MLKIKLLRLGKRNQPHYRIVVNEARDRRDGSYVENIGHYAPIQTPKLLQLNLERYDFWLSQGAQPTPTVAFLANVAKSGKGFPPKKKKPKKKKVEAQAEVKTEVESKVELSQAAENNSASEKKIESASEPQPELTPEVTPEVKSESELETKSESKVDSQPEK